MPISASKNQERQRTSGHSRVGWNRPETDDSDYAHTYGSSLVEEFVLSHDTSDVLRELVQNEFDAKGTKIEIHFGEDSLRILGNGSPIDSAGWKRLSVVLGSGRRSGSGELVPAKVNGIGSKNFGLRSLFLFGNEIIIWSGGKQTVLEISKGALKKPIPDPDSRHTRGIRIEVPYRTEREGRLEPFGQDREEHALRRFSDDLTNTLIKLAQPNSSKSLHELVVSSERCNRRLRWVQSARQFRTRLPGVRRIERQVRAFTAPLDGSERQKQETVREIEFQKNFDIPAEFIDRTIPGYFKVRGRPRIKIGTSLRMRGKTPKFDEPGLFFYPIGVAHCFTGNAISVNAPFEMDGNRSRLVDEGNSTWNAWLLKQASHLTGELLVSDWLERFGFNAFLATRGDTPSSVPTFREGLNRLLSEEECWPTRELQPRRGKRPILARASKIVIPECDELGGFLAKNRYLDESFARNEQIVKMAKGFGAKTFTLNSLIRLRCAGTTSSSLKTKLVKGEAKYYYEKFESKLSNIGIQKKFAIALETLARKLKEENLEDLRNSAATLAADGKLSSPMRPLWIVETKVASAIRLPKSGQLHPALGEYKVFTRFCRLFDIVHWAREVAEKAKKGIVEDDEREALYGQIIAKSGKFDRKTKSIIRSAPVLKDHRGRWVSPASLIVRQAAGAKSLEPVLHFPHSDFAHDNELPRNMRFRKRIVVDDLVRYAKLVGKRPELAVEFEETLWKHRKLLSAKSISRLSQIAFIANSLGGVSEPPKTYLRTPLNTMCLGSETAFEKGKHPSLYRRLRCPATPRSDDLIKHIDAIRKLGTGPAYPTELYTTLVQTMESEKKPTGSLANREILWIEGNYVAPAKVLVGNRHRRIFLDAVPQVRTASSAYGKAALALGAHSRPQDSHWLSLFRWYAQRYAKLGEAVLPSEECNSLRDAYSMLSEVPRGVFLSDRILLDRDGMLHSLKEAVDGVYVIDDSPHLADALAEQGVPIFFADAENSESLRFYESAGVKKLTDVCMRVGIKVGDAAPTPPGLRSDDLLEVVHSSEFASAVAALTEYELTTRSKFKSMSLKALQERLQACTRVVFVSDIQVAFRVRGHTANVQHEVFMDDGRFVCVKVRSEAELRGLLSEAIASHLGEVVADISVQRTLSDSIYRLLDSPSSSQMERYLRNRGVNWTPEKSSGNERTENEGVEVDDEQFDDEHEVVDYIQRMIFDEFDRRREREETDTSGRHGSMEVSHSREQSSSIESHSNTKKELPPIDQVELNVIAVESPPIRRGAGPTRMGGGNGYWQPRTRDQEEQDQEIGDRGEELVYRQELARVSDLGLPESRVVWVSRNNPGSDHDIRSVGGDGRDLWIEVKSTIGRNGRFKWTKSEFELALDKRDRYILYRVYEAGGTNPTAKRIRDPIGLLPKEQLKLILNSLDAEVAPLDSSREKA